MKLVVAIEAIMFSLINTLHIIVTINANSVANKIGVINWRRLSISTL